MRTALAALATGGGALAASMLTATPAWAHHGWEEFDTTRAYYISGTISKIDLGNPHSHVTITLDNSPIPQGFSERELPEGLGELGTRDTLNATRPYDQGQEQLELVLSGPDYLARWGMDRDLQEGEWLEMVGFVNESVPTEFRPELFWLEDGKAIRQRLGSLPNQPVPPGQNTDSDSASAPGGTDDSAGGLPPSAIWTGAAVVMVAIVAGGAVYLRRRAR
ncbi:DUF6152 family protein [Saccharomonospora sp. NPDC046836]|uniref:DUF6152 family protein n=1 Tax=Saccharomonospora sp. NPDC046836 TaxID=3156921 RepID=UPI003401B9BA